MTCSSCQSVRSPTVPIAERLPFSIRVLLEAAVRSCDGFQVKEKDVRKIIDWENQQKAGAEIPFKPSRVILQDLTGVPAVVDFAGNDGRQGDRWEV